MIELKGLSFAQNKKYQCAISRGYFDGYADDPRPWRRSFIGSFVWKHPQRVKVLDILKDILGRNPTWADLDDDIVRDFLDELDRLNLKRSSKRTMCAELKAVLNDQSNKVPSKNFMRLLTIGNSVSQAVYLTPDEMTRIIRYKPKNAIEEYVWRNFCVCMLTGARLSDAQKLTINNCDIETNTLSYVPQKTPGIIVSVPVDERRGLRHILTVVCQRNCCLDVFNCTIRRICKNVDIVHESSITRSENLVTEPKWKLVSSHTARRSFATNLYLSGISLEDIAQMMGHGKNIETTKRYICAERQVSNRVMSYFLPDDRHRESVEYRQAYNEAIGDALGVIDDYLGLPDDNLAVLAIKGLQKI